MSAPVVVNAAAVSSLCDESAGPSAEAAQQGGGDEGVDSGLGVVVMNWGLIPSFTKKTEKPDFFRAFNARSETVCDKNFFKRLVNRRRCVVVLEGFYEWEKLKNGQKQPFYVHFEDGRPLTMPGLWDTWHQEDGQTLFSFTFLTTEPSPALSWLHNRMPVIFRSMEDEAKWLDTDHVKAEELLDELRRPYDRPDLVWHPVDRKVGNMKYQGSDCTTPVEVGGKKPAAEGTSSIKSFFKQTSPATPSSGSKSQYKAVKREEQPSSPPAAPASPFAGVGAKQTTPSAVQKAEEEQAVNTDEAVKEEAKPVADESLLLLHALNKRPHGDDGEEQGKGQKAGGSPAVVPGKKKVKQSPVPQGQRTLQAFFKKAPASPSK